MKNVVSIFRPIDYVTVYEYLSPVTGNVFLGLTLTFNFEMIALSKKKDRRISTEWGFGLQGPAWNNNLLHYIKDSGGRGGIQRRAFTKEKEKKEHKEECVKRMNERKKDKKRQTQKLIATFKSLQIHSSACHVTDWWLSRILKWPLVKLEVLFVIGLHALSMRLIKFSCTDHGWLMALCSDFSYLLTYGISHLIMPDR